jgi:hypothetical protein
LKKSETSTESDHPCLDVRRSSITVTFGKVPVVVDLLLTTLGDPNVAAAFAGTDSDKVPEVAVVAGDSEIVPDSVGSEFGIKVREISTFVVKPSPKPVPGPLP